MAVGLNGRNSGEFKSIFSHNLTERIFGVKFFARLGDIGVGVNERGLIDVSGSEFGGVDFQISEQATSFPHSSDESRADPGVTIIVPPAVLFNDRVELMDLLAKLVVSDSGEFRDGVVLVVEVKSHLEGSIEDLHDSFGVLLLVHGEDWGQEFGGHDGREALIDGVDPAKQEVVVSVGHTFNTLEEFVGGSFVELGSDFLSQGEPDGVIVSIVSPLNPVLEGIDLETSSGPVPGGVRFDNVKFTVNSKSHNGVTSMGSRTILCHLVKTVHPDIKEEITRLNEFFRDIINSFLGSFGSLLVFEAHSFLGELNIFSDLFRSDFRTKEGDVRIKTKTSVEEEEGLHNIRIEVKGSVTTSEDHKTSLSDRFHIIVGKVIKCDLVGSTLIVSFHVGIGKTAVKISLGAGETFFVFHDMGELDGVLTLNMHGNGVIMPAVAIKSDGLAIFFELSNDVGKEFVEAWSSTGGTLEDILVLGLILLGVLDGINESVIELLEMLNLGEHTTFGEMDNSVRALLVVLDVVTAEEMVFDFLVSSFKEITNFVDGGVGNKEAKSECDYGFAHLFCYLYLC